MQEAQPSSNPPSNVGRSTLKGICPIDLRPLPEIEITDAEGVRRAIAGARSAQTGWAQRSFQSRVDALTRAAKAMLAARDEVIQLMRDETGKLEVDALMSEVLGPLDQVTSWAKVIGPQVTRKRVSLNPLNFPKKKAWVDRVPRGVVGIIAPWNYPLATLFRTVLPALLSGNGVVLKPSEYSTGVARWFVAKLMNELPPGLVAVVPGDKSTAIAMIESGIDACVFTGSVAAGKDVAARCGTRLIPVSVELGGKDAAIVLHDCDLDRTVAGITHWALHNVGQACGAIEIAYVDSRIADAFVERLRSAWSKLRTGPGAPGEVDISPVCNQAQLRTIEAHVGDALAKGAKLVLGGERDTRQAGLWYPPTLLDHCSPSMDVIREETFGPVLAVVRVAGAAEAIRQVNAARYGLTTSIWTRDHARALRLADTLEVGVVTINNHAMTGAIAALPWSGTRDTGPGVANSELSLHTLLRPKAILLDSNEAPELFWMPYDRTLWELGNLLSEIQIPKLGASLVKIPYLLKKRVDTVRAFFEPS